MKKATAKSAPKADAKPAKKAAKKSPARVAPKNPRPAPSASDAATLIDARLRELGDWRGETLARVRSLITQAGPDIVEEWKWDVPVWSCRGILCTGETYKNAVKLTFAKGAALDDPARLFNASLEGATRRAIDLHEGDTINERAFKALIRAAIAFNAAQPR